MEIFEYNYNPPVFDNWYLGVWITSMYSSRVLGPDLDRTAILDSWVVKHHVTATRYKPSSRLVTQWLPIEYERGRRKIVRYLREHHPNHQLVTENRVSTSLPKPIRVDPSVVVTILKVLPSHDGNVRIWRMDSDDSQFWHRATTGRFAFFEHDGLLKYYVMRKHPFLELHHAVFTATPPVDNNYESAYRKFVQNQTLDHSTWCELTMPIFRQTYVPLSGMLFCWSVDLRNHPGSFSNCTCPKCWWRIK
jgi:hypothetical protein